MDVNAQINSIFSTNQLHDLIVYYPTKFTSVLLSYWPVIIGVATLFFVLYKFLNYARIIVGMRRDYYDDLKWNEDRDAQIIKDYGHL